MHCINKVQLLKTKINNVITSTAFANLSPSGGVSLSNYMQKKQTPIKLSANY